MFINEYSRFTQKKSWLGNLFPGFFKCLLKIIKPGNKILDLGAGSGILSIVALKYGAQKVKAIEYDQDCEENFINNNLSPC